MMSQRKETFINQGLNILPFILLFVYLLIFHQNIYSFDADDSYFKSVHEKQSLSQFLVERYNGWSGRLSIEATAYIVLSYHIRLWRLLNSLVLTGLCFTMTCLLLGDRFWLQDHHETVQMTWAACLGIGLVSMEVLGSSAFWITGSFNYLWPIFAGSLALIPFRQKLSGIPLKITAKTAAWLLIPLLAAIYAGLGNEQVGLVLVGLMLGANIAWFITARRIEPYLLLLLSATIISLIIFWAAPGNQIRYEYSVAKAFPNFEELTLGQHLFLGIRWLLIKVVNVNRILLIALFSLMAVCLRLKAISRTDRVLAAVVTFLAAFLVVSSLNLDTLHPDFLSWMQERFYAFKDADDFARAYARLGRNANYYLFWIPYLAWLPILASIPFLLCKSSPNGEINGLVLAILFCAALASLVVMFFSPTIYVSGNRVVSVFSIILLFILGGLFYNVKDRIPLSVVLAVLLLAGLNILFQHVEWNNKYFIHW